MTIKSDKWIRRMALKAGMITPFEEGIKRPGIISYGLTSFGYDVRLSAEFITYEPRTREGILDPKCLEAFHSHVEYANTFIIPPHGFVLCRTVESFRIPRNVSAQVIGKSTYARLGLVVNCTPLESEWEGTITLELSNTTDFSVIVYANEGIAQVQFHESDEDCETSYADKAGKYQGQTGVTLPRVD